MSTWVWSGTTGVLLGAIPFVIFLVPIVIWQYRRYGRFTFLRLLGTLATSIYLAALVAYTLLPLPEAGSYDCVQGAQLQPFAFVGDILEKTAGMGLRWTLTSFVVLQVVFNVVLFVPWGVIARRFLGWGFTASVLSGAAISLVIETTQYTGLWGIYDCAYRFADVDDLITNTLGAAIGALLAPALLFFMPQERALRVGRLEPRRVTVWRRWMGMLADWFLLNAVHGLMQFAYSLAVLVRGATPAHDTWWQAGFWLASGALVFVLPALTSSGASLGQRAVWLAWSPSDAGRGRLLLRGLTSGGLYVVLDTIGLWESGEVGSGLSGLAAFILLATTVVAPLFTRDRRGLSGRVAGLELVDARTTLSPTPDRSSV